MISNIQNFQSLGLLYSNQNKSNTQKMSPLEKQKMNIQTQIQQITNDKTLSEEEKMQKIQALQENLDKITEQLGKQELEEMKNIGQKVAEKMQEDVEKETDEVQKEKKAQVAMNFGMISSSGEISKQRTLTYQRKKAVMEEGEGSARVKRIDTMLEDSRKTSLSGAYLASKAAAEYAKAKQANEEKELEAKLAENNKPVSQPEQIVVTDDAPEKAQVADKTPEIGKNVGEQNADEPKDVRVGKEPAKDVKKTDKKPHVQVKENSPQKIISLKVNSYKRVSIQKSEKIDIAG